jgi:hypothetical protein
LSTPSGELAAIGIKARKRERENGKVEEREEANEEAKADKVTFRSCLFPSLSPQCSTRIALYDMHEEAGRRE